MRELEIHISIAGPEKTDGLFTTQIILKTAELKEGTARIADKEASGGIVVFGLAIGPAFARMMRRSGFKTPSKSHFKAPSTRPMKRGFAFHSLSAMISIVIGYFCESSLYIFSAQR
jgi:hypothetical protein